MMNWEVWQQRREEMVREAELNRLAKALRAHRKETRGSRTPEKGVRMTQEVPGLGTGSPREGRICIAFCAVTAPPEIEARVRGRRS